MTWTWLVSSGGRRGALVGILQRSPGRGASRVVVTDASPLSAAGRLADGFELVPRVTSEEFVGATLAIADRYQVDAIVPTIDPELPVFAAHRDVFRAAGHDVFVSSPEVIELSADKWKLYQWLTTHGFPTVATWEARSFNGGDATTPVVAKPRGGSSSIGVIHAATGSALPLAELSDDYLIQHRASGIEITIDFAVTATGMLLGTVPRRRLEVRAGEVSKGVTVHLPVVEELVRDFATALPGAYGVLNMQVFYDPDTAEVRIIELNARAGGGYPLSHQAGADFFSALADKNDAVVPWQEDLVMLRYDDAAFFTSSDYRVR